MADETLGAVENVQGPAMKFGEKVDRDRNLQRKLERKMMRKFRDYAELEEVFEDIGRESSIYFR